jgi:hypothetical protein
MRSTVSTFTKQTMGPVRLRTSTKRSMTLLVAQFTPLVPGKSEERKQLGQILPVWVQDFGTCTVTSGPPSLILNPLHRRRLFGCGITADGF